MIPTIKTILYASDLLGETWRSLQLAYSIARQYEAKLIYVHVVNNVKELRETIKDFEINSRIDIQGILQQTLEKAESRMKSNVEKFLATEFPDSDTPIDIEVRVVEGYPSKTLLGIAEKENVDLIVMSCRTHGAIGQMVGSTTNKVMHNGKFPVLVIPYH
ncbi:MAG: universal stress protein [Marinobacter sp.]|uniref:universal stress protein n=1 Tax=Marinobacter sp. TaxID=50741 RepID=UPI0034A07FFC